MKLSSMRTVTGLVAFAAITGGASLVLQGPVPGDVAVTRALQAVLGPAPVWAAWLTGTAKAPLLWGTLAVAVALALRASGWRAALAVMRRLPIG